MAKPIKVTETLQVQVEKLAGYGMTDEDISKVVSMSEATLKRKFRDELDIGRALAKSKVQQTAFKMAISGKQPAMTMFWLKTQCHWKETTVNEHTGKDGKDLPSTIKVEFVKPTDENTNT